MGLFGGRLKKAASSAMSNLKNTVQEAGDAVSSTVQNVKKGAKKVGEKAANVAEDVGEGAKEVGEVYLKGFDWISNNQQKYIIPAAAAAAPFLGTAAAPILGGAAAAKAAYTTYDALREGKNPGTAIKNNLGDFVEGVRGVKKGASA